MGLVHGNVFESIIIYANVTVELIGHPAHAWMCLCVYSTYSDIGVCSDSQICATSECTHVFMDIYCTMQVCAFL